MKRSYCFVAPCLFALPVWWAGATILDVPSVYPTIQAGIDAAVEGDTVLVAPGTYPENIHFRGKNIVVASHFLLTNNPLTITSTIIDGSSPAHPDTASCVRIINGEDSTAVLTGFTLTGGTGTLWADEHGAGRYWEGGGIIIALSSPTITHNIIRDNNVNRTGGVSTGGGGIRIGDGSPRILNNVIVRNSGMYGGGIVMNYASPVIRNNIIASNIVSQAIAGLNTFGGGGIWLNGNVQGNKVENNTIAGNSATGSGGFGTGGRGGGMSAVFGAILNSANNIVWGNTQTTGGQIAAPSSVVNVRYSDVEGGFAGEGNIDSEPVFADSAFHLAVGSPCIDAGDPDAMFNDPSDPGNPDLAYWPAMGGVRNDMGAYGGPGSSLLGTTTSIQGGDGGAIPGMFRLQQNYPNPFNPNTEIVYTVGGRQSVRLAVYDVLGREVAALVDSPLDPGEYRIEFRAQNLTSGAYYCRLQAGEYVATRKLLLLR